MQYRSGSNFIPRLTKRGWFVTMFLSFAACLNFLATVSLAQDGEQEIKISTELASFEVSVTDDKGSPVKGLDKGDFKLYENGVERPIDFFQPIRKKFAGRPLTIVFALDVSGSMTEPELQNLRAAMQKFVARLADYESLFAVMSFAMNVRTAQGFTNRPEKLEQAFQRLRRDQDGLSTHAYDALDEAVRLIKRKSPSTMRGQFPRRAVILITDGFPVGDTVSPATVIERANENQTSIFTVLLPSYSKLQTSNRRILTPLEISGVSQRTGGISATVNDSNFDKIFDALAEEITSSYAIAYYPTNEDPADTNVRVRIETRPGLLIRQNRERVKIGN